MTVNNKKAAKIVSERAEEFRAYLAANKVDAANLGALVAAQKEFANAIENGENPATASKRPRKARTMGIFGVSADGARTLLETVTGTVTECKATAPTKVLAARWVHGEAFDYYTAALIESL